MATAAQFVVTHDQELLDRVMRYQHPGLVDRLQRKLDLTLKQATELFEDMKRFLFLSGTVLTPLAPPEQIDESWHNFILFTKDYAKFCQDYFGEFIHHVPIGSEVRASRDGSIVRNTKTIVRQVFGASLSPNWGQAFADCNDDPLEPGGPEPEPDPEPPPWRGPPD